MCRLAPLTQPGPELGVFPVSVPVSHSELLSTDLLTLILLGCPATYSIMLMTWSAIIPPGFVSEQSLVEISFELITCDCLYDCYFCRLHYLPFIELLYSYADL